jgi:hypothetical protein
LKQRAVNGVLEIMAALIAKPMALGDLAVRLQLDCDAVALRLRNMAKRSLVHCVVIDVPGMRGYESHTDRARLVWCVPGEQAMHLPAGARPPPSPAATALLTRRGKKRLDPRSDGRPEPIEILARMAGRSTFRSPRQPGGSSATPVTPLDIAHAIGAVCLDTATQRGNPLGAAVAMAMACQRPGEFPKVQRMAHGPLLCHLRAQREYRGIVDPPNTYRARIALYDAFHDLVAPARRRNLGKAARDARMLREMYRWLLHQTSAFLEAAANTAAADAVRFLFSLAAVEHPLHDKVRAVSVTATGEIQVWTDASAAEVDDRDADSYAMDVDLLCQDVLHRARRPGVLALKR